MDRRIEAGPLVAAAAGVVVVVSLFLDWFGLGGRDGITGWQAFEVLDLVLLGAAVAAIACALDRVDRRVLLAAAAATVVVVVSQLLQPPPAGQGAERDTGAWLALSAALVMAGGAALSLARFAVTVDVKGRPAASPIATPAEPVDPPTVEEPAAAVRSDDGALFAPPVDPDATQRMPPEPPRG